MVYTLTMVRIEFFRSPKECSIIVGKPVMLTALSTHAHETYPGFTSPFLVALHTPAEWSPWASTRCY